MIKSLRSEIDHLKSIIQEKQKIGHWTIGTHDNGTNTDINFANAINNNTIENAFKATFSCLEAGENNSANNNSYTIYALPRLSEFTTTSSTDESSFENNKSARMNTKIFENFSKNIIENVGIINSYPGDPKYLLIKFENFVEKFLKSANERLKRHSVTIRKKGATAIYRCKEFRNKDVSCKYYVNFSYINKNDSVIIKRCYKCIHINC